MSDSQLNVSLSGLRKEIAFWLQARMDDEDLEWIMKKIDTLLEKGEDWIFFSSFSAVPRYTGKNSLDLSEHERQQASEIRPGWEPGYWSVDQLGRTFLLLSIASRDQPFFLETLEKTFISSDMGEAVALYQSLPLLPYPEELRKRGAEGIRSNMTSVFNAVALRNPYPAEYFDQAAWNQLVLKALFVESPLYLIQGIDRRANEKLAEMLVDYAHERRAADRSVSPELWRPVGPFAKGEVIDDLEKVLEQPDDIRQQAAILALSASPSEKAKALVEEHKSLKEKIDRENISWDDIGRKFNE